MAREMEDYRANMERLNELFPEYELLSVQDVSRVTGFRSVKTVKKYIPFNGPSNTISKAALARIMCGGKGRFKQ